MPRRSPHLLAFLVCVVSCAELASGQQIRPQPHPNHYLIVVDASGSTATPENKRKLYESTLREKLVSYLYQKGFGPFVPPYDPSVDRLSLVHFGIIPSGSANPSRRLSDYSFSGDFIHGVFARSVGVDAEAFKQAVVSHQHYQNTILTWARQLALESTRPRDENEVNHRTFVIFVHDGKPNDNSVMAEIDMVRRDSTIDYNRMNPIIERIDLKYQFTNGEGKRVPAFSEEINNGNSYATRIFIEGYEVVSTADEEFIKQGKMAPLAELRWHSLDETGELPRATLAARITREFEEWTKSAKRVDFSLLSPPDQPIHAGLEMPVTFSRALTCSPDDFKVLFRASLGRSDRLLGTRTLDYESVQTLRGPVPTRCTRVFLVSAISLALLVLALLAAGWYYVRYRWFATHLFLQIPGTMFPLRLERSGKSEGYVAMTPQVELEACTLRLPHQLIQRIFYRNSRVTLRGVEQLLRWGGDAGSHEIRMPFGKAGRVPALWRALPQQSVEVEICFSQGTRSSSVYLKYPRALAERTKGRTAVDDKIKVFVSLDLGSESMAAYYEERGTDRGAMIRLQTYGQDLFDGDHGETKNVLLKERGNTSPRLLNRISFKEKAQPREPLDDHARLEFISADGNAKPGHPILLDEYKKSLFRLFHVEGDWPPSKGILPNPKILFQQRIVDVLQSIEIAATDGGYVNLTAEMLIKHLTAQVINNLVVRSPELQRYSAEEIHLTITVPNVYSLPHAESIKEFVGQQIPHLGAVEVISESDAVAYYALRRTDEDRDSPELLRFKADWAKELERAGKLCLVTVDVGKGTTDLSCILVTDPANETFLRSWFRKDRDVDGSTLQHSVQAKTGKSSGGNYLNYLFAKYYDRCLKEAFQDGGLSQKTPPFGFVRQSSFPLMQKQALAELEVLIERVKASMTENLEVDEGVLNSADQLRLALEVSRKVCAPLVEGRQFAEADLKAFQAQLAEKLVFPIRKSGRSRLRKLFEGGSAEPGTARSMESASALYEDIEKYVKENVEDLFESLRALVRDHQGISDDRADIDSSSFVIISGQGSQFRPLRRAIEKICQSRGIPKNQILPLEGIESKEACSKGVVNFWKDEMVIVNNEELHGTYGCKRYFNGDFTPFNMKNVNTKSCDELNLPHKGRYDIVFTPRSLREVEDRRPEVNDGATALLGVFEGESKFKIEYDPDTLKLRVNGRDLSVGTFGTVDRSIYERVWPEMLEPPQE